MSLGGDREVQEKPIGSVAVVYLKNQLFKDRSASFPPAHTNLTP